MSLNCEECGWSGFCFKYHRFELFSQSFGRFSWIYVFLHLLYALRTISRNFKCGFLKIIFTRESLRSSTCHHTGGRTRSHIVFKVISGSKMIVNLMKEFELYKYDYLWLLGFVNRQITKVLSAYALHNFYSTLQGWKFWWIWSLERLNNLLLWSHACKLWIQNLVLSDSKILCCLTLLSLSFIPTVYFNK